MKYYKLCIFLFCVTFILVSFSTFASSAVTFADVTLPKGNNYYQTTAYTKEIDGKQYYKSTATTSDCFPYSDITGVFATTYGLTYGDQPEWLTVDDGLTATWRSSSETNIIQGNYYLRLKRNASSLLCTASHWGTWYLDNRLMN